MTQRRLLQSMFMHPSLQIKTNSCSLDAHTQTHTFENNLFFLGSEGEVEQQQLQTHIP